MSSPSLALPVPRAAVRRPRRVSIGRVAVYLLLIVGGIVYTVPFLWMLSTSLTDPGRALDLPPRWIPRPVVVGNYARAWTVLPVSDFTRNSVV